MKNTSHHSRKSLKYPDINIVLVGFMGAGKTSVGQYMAKILNKDFLDTDSLIEKRCQMTINQIFLTKEEAFFRQQEDMLLGELSSFKNTVIATGGGIGTKEEHISLLKTIGVVVYLSACWETICLRIKNTQSRPLWKDPDFLKKLLKQREPFYRQAADLIIPTDEKTAKEIALLIKKLLLETKKNP